MKISKQINDKGKAAFEKTSGVKNRGKMPPPGQTHKKKKGKGSYDRKNAFDEDEQDLGEVPPNPNYKKPEKLGSVPLGGGYVKPKPKKKSLGKRIADKFVNRSVSGGKKSYDEDEEGKDCWKGYKKKGTKKKGGKTVNNCVKENTEIQAFVEAIINEEPSKAFDHLRKAAELKLQNRIEAEMDKPIF
jgi:hypothetical protein